MSKSEDVVEALKAIEGQAAYEDIQKYGTTATPEGWTPGVNWTGNAGEIVTGAIKKEELTQGAVPTVGSWDEWLRRYGLDPEEFEIINDTVRFTAWDGWRRDKPGQEAYLTTLYSFRAVVKPKSLALVDTDIAVLYESIKDTPSKKRPRKSRAKTGYSAFIINLADWQIGNGDTTAEEQIAAIHELRERLPDAIADARSVGHRIDEIVLAGLGDLVEQCFGSYPSQEYTVTLNRREQTKVVRRGVRDIIVETFGLAPTYTCLAVGGNHGENRKGIGGGKGAAYTGRSDNDDVAVFEALAEGFQLNSDFKDKIQWKLPIDHLVVSHQIGDQIVSWTHGHLARRKASGALETQSAWWKDQQYGGFYPSLSDSSHLVTGHYHHPAFRQETTGKMLYVCPSLTRNSVWFGDATGIVSSQGTLTMVVGDEVGVDLIRVI